MLQRQLRRLLKPIAAAVDRVHKPPPGVVVLAYHRVGAGTASQVDLDTGLFAEQMAYLAEHHRLLSLDDAVAALVNTEAAADTEPAVVVTFDDGTPDIVENALPALVAHQVPMTLYLASGFVDDGLGFWAPTDAPLTWAGVNELTSTGLVTIGSHTHTHKLLDREPAHVVADELARSQACIAEHVGAPASHFAYPKALRPSPDADAEVRARFASAALAGTKPNPWRGTDVHQLARSPIQQADGMRWFQHKARGGLGLEDAIRDRVKQRSYKNAQR